MRILATRDFGSEISQALPDVLAACKARGFDLIVVETSGIGQGDAAIVPLVDVPMYVMTPEFGAASQLEKIDMLDFAEFVAINKFDRKGAADALRDVAKQVQRNTAGVRETPTEQMPVFGTMASRFNDDGVTALYQALLPRLAALGLQVGDGRLPTRRDPPQHPPGADRAGRARALPGRHRRHRARLQGARAARQARLAREIQQLRAAARMLTGRQARPRAAPPRPRVDLAEQREARHGRATRSKLLSMWPDMQQGLRRRRVRGEDPRQGDPHRADPHHAVGQQDPQGRAADRTRTTARSCKWLMLDNVPGSFPYTAGTFAFKREGEDPTRMFAGEGDAFRTNTRFKLLSAGMPAKRLSHRVRLGHAVRQRPGPAARHLRQGRQLAASASPRSTT